MLYICVHYQMGRGSPEAVAPTGDMAGLVDPEIDAYCAEHTPPESEALRRLVVVTREKTRMPGMQVGRLEGAFLRLLVRLVGAERVLEIGTFTGYSALAMAEGLPPHGRLITCDIDPDATRIAKAHWAKSPHGKKIDLRLGDARHTLAGLDGPFDLAFLDADKTGYATYWDLIVPKMRPGGLIVADNTLWSGEVLRPEDDDGRALAAFNDRVRADARVDAVLLPVRDGMTLARVVGTTSPAKV